MRLRIELQGWILGLGSQNFDLETRIWASRLGYELQRGWTYDGEHLTARFSVSTGVKKENSMRIKVRKNIKRIIEVYPSKYFIAKFASK